uniref:Galacturonic acid reductase n=1 Tax=Solanum tuberosum TaxID=4113 RepID=M1DC41_SOLTU
MQQVTLNNCDKPMPAIGMGTVLSSRPGADPSETMKSTILEAIKAGYRHFDTAFIYQSEKPLGEAIVEAIHLGFIKSRDELFITTKLWCTFAQRDQIVGDCKLSLSSKRMIHPLDIKGVWEGMEECKNLGLTKGIGVSNFSRKKLEELLFVAKIPPAVNQVALRWIYEQGMSLVVKSLNKERMKENLQIFDWSLTQQDLEKISELPQHKGFIMASSFGPHDFVLQLDAGI